MHKLKGDTLVEVALAIGIFSMVAITVVSVVSASTSSAQSALETTITREELDAQAEALRFIHDSYVSGSQSQNTEENPYAELWNNLTINAINEEEILDYKPATCSDVFTSDNKVNTDNVYKDGKNKKNLPFILNIRQLSSGDPKKIIVRSDDDHKIFQAPGTYPRILYGKDKNIDEEDLFSQVNSDSPDIKVAEGLYIIVTKGSHTIIEGTTPDDKTAYYDFYIRSCWMPLGSDRASTISTVVRLYDPAVIEYK